MGKNTFVEKIWRLTHIVMVVIMTAVLLYAVIGEALLPNETEDSLDYCEVFERDWYQIHDDGTKEAVSVPGIVTSDDGQHVTIETTLPAYIQGDAYLAFKNSKQDYDVYIDGELRTSFSTKDTRLVGKNSPTIFVFVPLRVTDGNKTLRIETTCGLSYLGSFKEIYYTNKAGFWMHVWKNEGMVMVVGAVIFAISILCVAVSIVIRVIYRRTQKLGSLSIATAVVCIWIFGNSTFRQILVSNLSLVSDLTYIMVSIMPIPFAMYLDQLQRRRYTALYIVIQWLGILDFIGCNVLAMAGILDYAESFLAMALVLLLLVISIAVTIVADIIRKYIMEYIVTAVAIAIAAVVLVIQLSVYMNVDKDFNVTPAALGLLMMLLIASVDTFVDMQRIEREKRQALEASATKSQFLANMSHEIRTPINAVLGLNEMIMKESQEKNIQSYAMDVENSGKALLALVNDILDFSKIESGKMEVVNVDFDLKELIDQLVLLIRPRARSKDINLGVIVDASLPRFLHGDSAKVQQIITNLLTNAVKYTDKGNVRLRFGGSVNDDGALMLEVAVADTGRGIKPEDQDKLFDSFIRLDQKANRSIEGTGLGLAITKNMVDLLNGEIRVKSAFGHGSTFIVTLPLDIVKDEPIGDYDIESQATNPDKIERIGLQLQKPVRILVVDDVPINLKIVEGFLKTTDVVVDARTSARQALEAWEKQTYDLVFLDHMMPGMDGVECADHMWKKREVNKDTPVIMLTANAVSGMAELYKEHGMSDYMTKPFTQEQLFTMLEKYIEAVSIVRI